MRTNPFIWCEIYVQDMPRAKAFYEKVFEFELQKLGSPSADMELWAFPMEMDKIGGGGALVKMQGAPSGGNSTIAYFHCADCAVEANRVVAAGGKIHKDKMSIGEYGFIVLAYDTEGNMFGMHTPPSKM